MESKVHMVNRFSLQLFFQLFIVIFSSAVSANNEMTLEQQLNKVISDEDLMGIVWSTVSNGDVNVGSAGFANIAQNSLMTDSQKMHVGSVTKTVLALGTLRLITEGKLTLDTHVATLLPEIALNNPWKNSAPIKVKHLLDHTAGLDNLRMWQFLNSTPTPDTPLKDAFPLNNHELLKIRTKPGSQYSYSNMGYTLLGMVIEAASQTRYEDYLDKQLLQPLGMLNSSFKYISQTGQYADEALSMGYFENNVAQAAVPMFLRPAGQFTTTAPDMAKFMTLLLNDGVLNDGVLNGKPFIRHDLMQKLASPEQTDAQQAGLAVGHGLALAIRDRHDVVGLCHPGTTIGFRAYICLFPKEHKSFFYAINTDNETADYEKFNSIFIKHLSIEKAPVTKASKQTMDLSVLEGVYLPAPNNMAEFEWLDLVFNFQWLTRQESKLVLSSLQSDDRVLLPLNSNLLRATDRTQASHAIFTDEQNDIYISNGLSTYKKHSTFIIAAYWLSLILGLTGLMYITLVGIARVLMKKMTSKDFIFWPLLNILAFSIPTVLYSQQSFIYFGEITLASFFLAVLSGGLLVTVMLSLFFVHKTKLTNSGQKRDCLALLMLWQLCLVLCYWNVFPVIFWQ